MERATRLLIDICGGEAGPVIDVTNEATCRNAQPSPCAAASWIV
jgi:phenylalanyl-tRNA synthetase beta subunit